MVLSVSSAEKYSISAPPMMPPATTTNDAMFSTGSSPARRVVADVGDDQRNGRKCGGADGKALADGGGGVANGVQLVGDDADVCGQMAGFGQTAGVVGDGAEGVDGNRRADEGQHAQRGKRDAVGAAELAGDEQRNADDQNRQQAGAGADGVALGDDERFALGGNLGQLAGGLVSRCWCSTR